MMNVFKCIAGSFNDFVINMKMKLDAKVNPEKFHNRIFQQQRDEAFYLRNDIIRPRFNNPTVAKTTRVTKGFGRK